MERNEAIEWLKSIKETHIHGGDDFYDYQRRTAIDYAVAMLKSAHNAAQKPQTNADRIRAMSDEELVQFMRCCKRPTCEYCANGGSIESICNGWCDEGVLEWLKQPAFGDER